MTLDLPAVAADPLDVLDPEIAEFVRRSMEAGRGYPPRETLSAPQARLLALETRRQWFEGGPIMARTEERMIPTRHGELRMRLHRPEGVTAKGAFLYLPGGGWVLFSVDTHDRLMREYADAAKMIVIGVDYSRAPEARFPQPVEELDDVLDWLFEHADELGFDPARLAMGGDSAGANLTAATSLKRRDEGKVLPAGMILNYGSYDLNIFTESVVKWGGGSYLLTTHMMVWFQMQYMRTPEDVTHPWASPIRAHSKAGLPQTLMVMTDCDVLYDSNIGFEAALREAGVDVTARLYPGTVHSFLEAMSIAKVSRRAIRETAEWLRERVG